MDIQKMQVAGVAAQLTPIFLPKKPETIDPGMFLWWMHTIR
jgi:hypothetical protein